MLDFDLAELYETETKIFEKICTGKHQKIFSGFYV